MSNPKIAMALQTLASESKANKLQAENDALRKAAAAPPPAPPVPPPAAAAPPAEPPAPEAPKTWAQVTPEEIDQQYPATSNRGVLQNVLARAARGQAIHGGRR